MVRSKQQHLRVRWPTSATVSHFKITQFLYENSSAPCIGSLSHSSDKPIVFKLAYFKEKHFLRRGTPPP